MVKTPFRFMSTAVPLPLAYPRRAVPRLIAVEAGMPPLVGPSFLQPASLRLSLLVLERPPLLTVIFGLLLAGVNSSTDTHVFASRT